MTDERVVVAADFWASRFLIDDKCEAFRSALIARTEAALAKYAHITLQVDYDPWDELLEAVRDAGVTCSGFMFSARGIFNAQKTRVRIDADKVTLIDGYAAPSRVLWARAGLCPCGAAFGVDHDCPVMPGFGGEGMMGEEREG